MNSKVKPLNLRAACMLAALSLNLTATASLAQSSAASQTTVIKTATTTSGVKNVSAAAPVGTTSPTVVAKTSDLVALQGPTVVTQKGTGWKTTTTFLDLKDGQQALPLTFTITNGAGSAAKMQGIEVKLNGREIVGPKTMKDKDSVAIDLSGLVNSGQSQLIFQTFGPTGAACSWVLTTLKIKVTDIKPVSCAIGDVVKITGKNFPTDKSAYRVTVDQKSATIKSATATSIDFIVPEGLSGGKKTVTLYIAGVKCDPLYIKVAAAPDVTGCNLLSASQGCEITISGTGFSTTASDNVVLFKNTDGVVQASVTAKTASDTALTVNVPENYPCPSDMLVTVKTKGQESAKGVNMSCSTRIIDKGVVN